MPEKKNKRRWLRILLLIFGGVLLLLALLHRPILHWGIRQAAVHFAPAAGLEVDLHVSGSIFFDLQISNLTVTGDETSPVESVTADRIALGYRPVRMLQGRWSRAIRYVEASDLEAHLHALEVELEPEAGVDPGPPAMPEAGPTLPILPIPGRIDLRNVSIYYSDSESIIAVEGFDLLLDPEQPGRMFFSRIEVPDWFDLTEVDVPVSVANRVCRIGPWELNEDFVLHEFEIDAQKVRSGLLQLHLQARLFHGPLSANVALQERGRGHDVELHVAVETLDAGRMQQYGVEGVEGILHQLELKFDGHLQEPNAWQAQLGLETGAFTVADQTIESVQAHFLLQNGRLDIRNTEITGVGGANVRVRAHYDLPEDWGDWLATTWEARVEAKVADFSQVDALQELLVGGSADVKVRLEGNGRELLASTRVTASDLALENAHLESAEVEAEFRRSLEFPKEEWEWVETTPGTVRIDGRGLEAAGTALERLTLRLKNDGGVLVVEELTAVQGENRLQGTANVSFPEKKLDLESALIEVDLRLDAPVMADFVVPEEIGEISGALVLTVRGQGTIEAMSGRIELHGEELAGRGMVIEKLESQARFDPQRGMVEHLELRIDEENHLVLNGHVDLEAPHAYEGALQVHLANLGVFNPLLATEETPEPLAGELQAAWSGNGKAMEWAHQGRLRMELINGSWNDFPVRSDIEVKYGADDIEISRFEVASGETRLELSGGWEENRLLLEQLALHQGERELLTGRISMPLELAALMEERELIPGHGELAIEIESRQLALEQVASDFGMELPVAGTFTISLQASGTMEEPEAVLTANVVRLRWPEHPEYKSLDIDLRTTLSEGILNAAGSFDHPDLQTANLSARCQWNPFSFAPPDEDIPLEARLELPSTSMAFLAEWIPGVREITGTAGLQLNVSGTVGEPSLDGEVNMDIPSLRFVEVQIPNVSDFQARILMREQRIDFERFRGEMAGGPIQLGGNIRLDDEEEQLLLDLNVRGEQTLLYRDENATVRADLDLNITGPLEAGRLAGEIGVTNSRFFREFELLPMVLRGTPAPAAPQVEVDVTFGDTPLADWEFDVHLHTLDPFLIRGNMVNGEVDLDLRLGGTGERPWLEGDVQIVRVVGRLPFSRLTISDSRVHFDQNRPFQPQLEIQGRSRVQDYSISLFLYGSAEDPNMIFLSEPPLTQEDIISLLATGTTIEQLTDSPGAIAGRATILAIQQLYEQLFGRRDFDDDDNFLDRLEVDLGSYDARTGTQLFSTRFRLTDQFYLIGDVDALGDIRGRVKYLLRFR